MPLHSLVNISEFSESSRLSGSFFSLYTIVFLLPTVTLTAPFALSLISLILHSVEVGSFSIYFEIR